MMNYFCEFLILKKTPLSQNQFWIQLIDKIIAKMLLVDMKNPKLPRRYIKVLNISPAINNTFVFLGIKSFQTDCLTHFDSEKNLLAEKTFKYQIDSFAMLSESEVMILETRDNRFSIWNLETHQWTYVPFYFKNQEVDQSMIYFFPETKFLCIQENGRFNDNTFRLSYFRLPLDQKSEPFNVFDSEEAWCYLHMIRRANNHSMVCWFQSRHDDGFEFMTYDLRDDPDGKYNIYEIPNTIGKGNKMEKAEVAVLTMWQMRVKEFLLVCVSNRPEGKDGPANNNYIANGKTNTIRETRFDLGKYQDTNIDPQYMGNMSMFRCFQFEDGEPLESPIYYVNNETEEIVAEDLWKCSHLHKYFHPGWDGDMIIECMYQNANVDEVILISKKVMDPKQITVHFMNELFPDPDYDLLHHVTRIIDYSTQISM